MSNIFQVPGYITKVTTMNRWWRITVDTQETVSNEEIAKLLDLMKDRQGNERLGHFTFSLAEIKEEDVIDLPEIVLRPEDKRSPAQDLRLSLWKLWKAKPEGFEDSEAHYRSKMARLKEWVEEQIP